MRCTPDYSAMEVHPFAYLSFPISHHTISTSPFLLMLYSPFFSLLLTHSKFQTHLSLNFSQPKHKIYPFAFVRSPGITIAYCKRKQFLNTSNCTVVSQKFEYCYKYCNYVKKDTHYIHSLQFQKNVIQYLLHICTTCCMKNVFLNDKSK